MADEVDAVFDDDLFDLPAPLPDLDDGAVDGLNLPALNDSVDAEGDNDKKTGNKKKTAKKQKRLLLNQERLLDSERGLSAVKDVFANVKFKGKGHEASDLKLLLHHYEHWAHRLFPKYPFEDFVEKVESLGTKRLVRVSMSRLRLGLDDDHEPLRGPSDEEGSGERRSEEERVSGERQNNPDFGADFGVDVQSRPPPEPVLELSAEQLDRIRRNRELALAKREAAMRARLQQHQLQQLEENDHMEADTTEKTDMFGSTDKSLELADHSATTGDKTATDAPTENDRGDEVTLGEGRTMDSEMANVEEQNIKARLSEGDLKRQDRRTESDVQLVDGLSKETEADSGNGEEDTQEYIMEDITENKRQEQDFEDTDQGNRKCLPEMDKADNVDFGDEHDGRDEETQDYNMEGNTMNSILNQDLCDSGSQNAGSKGKVETDNVELANGLETAEDETQDYNMEEDTMEYKTVESTQEINRT